MQLALLVIAVASRDPALIRAAFQTAGLVIRANCHGGLLAARQRCNIAAKDLDGGGGGAGIDGEKPDIVKGGRADDATIALCAYILFDTRMDIPEAQVGPELAALYQAANIAKFPEEFFMVMRVVTIMRGMLGALKVDVSAVELWEPFARQALGMLADGPPLPKMTSLMNALPSKSSSFTGSRNLQKQLQSQSVFRHSDAGQGSSVGGMHSSGNSASGGQVALRFNSFTSNMSGQNVVYVATPRYLSSAAFPDPGPVFLPDRSSDNNVLYSDNGGDSSIHSTGIGDFHGLLQRHHMSEAAAEPPYIFETI